MTMPVAADRAARFLEVTSPERGGATLDEIAQRIAEGEGLPLICKALDFPYSRVLGWLMADAGRYAVYQRALEIAAHALVAEAVPLADGAAETKGAVSKATLQVNTRFKVAKHHAAKLYGESDAVGKVLPQVTIAIGVRVGSAEKPALEGLQADDDI